MRQFASVLTLVVGMSTFAETPTNRWPIFRIEESVIKIRLVDHTKLTEDGKPTTGSCTATAVQPSYFLTAAHCIAPTMHTNGTALSAVEVDTPNDIALLTGALEKPTLPLGNAPIRGEDILLVGYTAPPQLFFFPGLIVGEFDPWGKGELGVVTSANAISGMSGGPIVNRKGELVGLITGGGNPTTTFQNVGIGVTYKALKKMWQRALLLSRS